MAGELAAQGVKTTVYAPDPFAPWTASYGTFEKLLPDAYQGAVRFRFERPLWITRQGQSGELNAPYVRLDTIRLQGSLLERARGHGVEFVARSVESLKREAFRDQAVVDATGRTADDRGRTRYQTAYGMWARVAPAEWLAEGRMIFMDLRPATADAPARLPPSFLYATREGQYHFFEETVLVSDEPCAFEVLAERLKVRLSALGLAIVEVEREERCVIAMGGALPSNPIRSNRVAFGARAGLTQPASGYQLARCLELAPRVAKSLASGASPETSAALARAQLWSLERRATYALFDYGAEVLAGFGQEELTAFMEVFLGMPEAELIQFIDGRLGLGGALRIMTRTFSKVNRDLKWRLLRVV